MKILQGLLLGIMLTQACSAASPKNMIVFGDSLSDVGNNTWIEAIGTPLTNFDVQGNKSTWAGYLSQKWIHKPAVSSSQPNVQPLTDNVIYAYASSDTSADYLNADWPNNTPIPTVNSACTQPGLMKDNQENISGSCVPGVLQQVDLYLKEVKGSPNPESLFLIWAGANDLFYKLPTGESPQKIIETTITNLLLAKNKLLENGVSPQQIYIINLPDLSLTPYAIQHKLNLTALTVGFNNYLSLALTNTADPKHPGLSSTHVISMFDLLNDIVKSPEKYDIKNTKDSCVEKSETPLCKAYLFYDGKHPTALTHHIIADEISKKIS